MRRSNVVFVSIAFVTVMTMGLAFTLSLLADSGREPAPPVVRFHLDLSEEAPDALDADTSDRHRLATAPAVAGWYSAAPGTRLCYDLLMRGYLEMRDHRGDVVSASQASSHLDAAMTVLIVDRRGDDLIARLRFDIERLQLARADTDTGAFAQLLSEGIDLRMNTTGEITGLRFAHPGLSDDRNLARSLITALRFVVAPDAGPEWTVEESDLTGTARVRYRLLSDAGTAEVRRQKLDYAGADGAPAPRVAGAACAQFARHHGWWTSIRAEQQLAIEIAELGAEVHERWNLRVDLTAATLQAAPRVIDLWDRPWSRLAPGEPSELARLQDERSRREAGAGLSLADVLVALEQMATPEHVHSTEFAIALRTLSDLLRYRPGAAAELGRRLLAGEGEPSAAGALLAALGMAGHSEAQSALVGLLQTASVSEPMREAAAQSMAQLAQPDERALRSLVEICEAGRHGPARDAALVSLGTLASRTRGEQRAALADRLLGCEPRGRGEEAEVLWLESLGNAGLEQNVAVARRYLERAGAAQRHAAVGALREVAGADAETLLCAAARGDAAAPVRRRALELLAQRNAMAAAKLLRDAAELDPDADVRAFASSLLRQL